MGVFTGKIAVVTGASSGIGRAIAVALSKEEARVCALGRNQSALAETVAAAQKYSKASSFMADLTVEADFKALVRQLQDLNRLDILIHSAGVIHQSTMERGAAQDLDLQYAVNVRAPFLLTQHLLPQLTASRGQVVFINSSAGLIAKRPEIGQYAATKHALKAIADSLREEVNPKGVRVLSLYLGRTASPMQAAIFREEGREYHPDTLMQAEDVANVVIHALTLPPTAEVTDISIRPMQKS